MRPSECYAKGSGLHLASFELFQFSAMRYRGLALPDYAGTMGPPCPRHCCPQPGSMSHPWACQCEKGWQPISDRAVSRAVPLARDLLRRR